MLLKDGRQVNFGYDRRGNQLTGDGRSLKYTEDDKPWEIVSSGVSSRFIYSSDGQLARQERNGGWTHYVDRGYEYDDKGGWRVYAGDVGVIGYSQSEGYSMMYTLRDRLGSATTLVDEQGVVVSRRSYDPFGGMEGEALSDLQQTKGYLRGFTEHEHLNEHKLIHMIGRVYDYRLGRFLSVDPIIQNPGDSQSFNPYSYIMNNPLAGTDPTGY
ncbi:RHS repeat-associated core domain-containing protein, partial [Chromatiaceae bacterium AAb-1]|nr:RHS repeat-associated core domain-containing protein [Chromatiaceae bacterium AAb-1]